MTSSDAISDCPVCRQPFEKPVSRQAFGEGDRMWPGRQFDCTHCGKFIVDEIELNHMLGYLTYHSVLAGVSSPLQIQRHRAVMAHALRRMEVSGKTPVITDGMTLRILQEDRLPSLAEQRDNLLLWFRKSVEIGRSCSIGWEGLGARVGADSPGAFQLLLESMLSQGLLSGKMAADGGGEVRLAHRGLERLEQLERATPSGYNAFMAMQFGDVELDRIVDTHFRPAVKEAGFQLLRLDDKPEAGLIDARLRNEIRNCRFLIADLSHANAGSYWEAGYAEGLGKPVIYTCKKSVFEGKATGIAKPHFDTNHHLTIIWDKNDPQSAANRLQETIRFTIPEAKQA